MAIYMLNLVVVSVCGYMAEVTKRFDEEKNRYKYKIIFIIVAALSLILVSGFRYKVGTDFTQYSEYIIYYDNSFDGIFNEAGFAILLNISRAITENPQLFFMITSIIVNVCVITFLIKNTDNMFLSLYFYITTFMFYLTMNGVRQYIASVIVMLGYRALVEGNFKKYLIYVGAAFTFHSTVIFMIPVYFIARKRIDSVWNIGIFFFAIMAMLFYGEFIEILFELLKDTRFAYYKEIFLDGSGANPIRIIVWMAPVVLIFMYKDRARKVFGENVDIVVNLCYLGSIFMILASKQVFFARMCMYFDGYYLLLLPKLCSMFEEKTNKFMTALIMVAYLGYSLLLLRSGEAWISPYNYNLQLF